MPVFTLNLNISMMAWILSHTHNNTYFFLSILLGLHTPERKPPSPSALAIDSIWQHPHSGLFCAGHWSEKDDTVNRWALLAEVSAYASVPAWRAHGSFFTQWTPVHPSILSQMLLLWWYLFQLFPLSLQLDASCLILWLLAVEEAANFPQCLVYPFLS